MNIVILGSILFGLGCGFLVHVGRRAERSEHGVAAICAVIGIALLLVGINVLCGGCP